VGDFDGDGHLDIVVANGVDDTVSVLLATGSGNFQAQATFPVGSFAHGVALGDFDEDGHLDIVASNAADDTVSILLGRDWIEELPAAVYIPCGAQAAWCCGRRL
jgi:hypothetical protein